MYGIYWNDKKVGHVKVKKDGLYYRLECICSPPQEGIHRIIVGNYQNRISLGICVPQGREYGIKTCVPVKKLTGVPFLFTLVEIQKRIAVFSGMKFEEIDKLNAAHLEIVHGQQVLVIDESQDQ